MAKIPVSGMKPAEEDIDRLQGFNGPKSTKVMIVRGGGGSQEWRKRVREIVFPIKFDRHGTHFFDAEGKMIAQVRGWGGLTSSGIPDNEAADVQTSWGVFMETAVNAYAAGQYEWRYTKDELPAVSGFYDVSTTGTNDGGKTRYLYATSDRYDADRKVFDDPYIYAWRPLAEPALKPAEDTDGK